MAKEKSKTSRPCAAFTCQFVFWSTFK